MGLTWGGTGSSRTGWLSLRTPLTCSSPSLCCARQRLWVSLQNPNSQFFCKQTAWESQGMLEALSPGSQQGGRGWHCATRLRFLPWEEHHLLLLPDGISSSPLAQLCFVSLRCAAFPCQCVGWQWSRSPFSKHTETLPPHPSLNFTPALSSRPFKGNVEPPLQGRVLH